MFRTLIIVAAIVLVVLIIRNRLRAANAPAPRPHRQVDSVQCSHCRQYLPATAAVRQDDRFFCNQEHLDAWRDDTAS